MNREIKFSYIFQHSEIGRFTERIFTINELGIGVLSLPDVSHDHYGLVARRQFTGILDRNGKEIYEGDVVMWARTPKIWRHWKIEYADEGAMFYAACLQGGGCSLHGLIEQGPVKILGNIYENLELAEGCK